MVSLTESVETFLKEATWLTDVDQPMVTLLRGLAAEIDSNGMSAALANTLGVTYRSLLKSRGTSDDVTEAEDFLNNL